MIRRSTAVLTAALLLSCDTVTYVDTETQLLLRVEVSEDDTRSQATALRVAVATLDGERWVEVPPLKLDAARLRWPVEVPVFPRRDEAQGGRLVEMVVDLLRDEKSLAQTRVLARYVRGERRVVEAVLYVCASEGGVCERDACHGSECLVCDVAQRCVPTPTREAGSDDLLDGGSEDPSALGDAAQPLDGSTASLPDSGPRPCTGASCRDAGREGGAEGDGGAGSGDDDGAAPEDDASAGSDADVALDGMVTLPEAGTLTCPASTVCNQSLKAFIGAYVGSGLSTCTEPNAAFPASCSSEGTPCAVSGARGTCQNGFCIVPCTE